MNCPICYRSMVTRTATRSIRIGRKKFVYSFDYHTCGIKGHAWQDEAQIDAALKKIADLKTAAQKLASNHIKSHPQSTKS